MRGRHIDWQDTELSGHLDTARSIRAGIIAGLPNSGHPSYVVGASRLQSLEGDVARCKAPALRPARSRGGQGDTCSGWGGPRFSPAIPGLPRRGHAAYQASPPRGEQTITQRFTVGYPVGQRECSSRKDGYQRGSAHVQASPRGGPQEGGAAAPRDKPLGYFQAFLRDAISREGPGRRLTTGVAINQRYYENPSPRHSCALTQTPHLAKSKPQILTCIRIQSLPRQAETSH